MTCAPSLLQQRGMTMIEVMISVTIGLLITLAVSSLFLSTNRSNKENNDITLMQENARFALETLAADVRHAGFFGNVQNPADIDRNSVAMPTPSTTDCGSTAASISDGTFMLNFSSTQNLLYYATSLSNSALADAIAPCTVTGTLPATNNAILAIKRTSSNGIAYSTFTAMTTGKETGRIFVHSNGSTASLGSAAATPVPTTAQIWEYLPRYYYITNTHTLYRKTFGGETAGEWLPEPLAEGIERFQVEFGVDTDDDGAPNYFSDVPANIVFNGVVSARVHVLARTTRVDPYYDDRNTYTLGSFSVTPSTDSSNTDPNKTHYHRQVYSTTVTIPNLRRRHTIN